MRQANRPGEQAAELHGSKRRSGFSLRSQRNLSEEGRLESELKGCKEQINFGERKLATAQEGKKRQAGQLAACHGYAQPRREGYVQDVLKAERMISALNEQAAMLSAQIDALRPTPAKAGERAEGQKILAQRMLAREEGDRKLDVKLGILRNMLKERAAPHFRD